MEEREREEKAGRDSEREENNVEMCVRMCVCFFFGWWRSTNHIMLCYSFEIMN